MYKSQQAIFSLYLAVLPSLAFSQASSSSQQTDDLLSRHKAAQAECVALFSAPTLAPLAGKVPFPVTQDIPTAAMLRLNRKPNAAEFKALESYSTMRRICFSKLAKAFVGEGDIPDYYKAYMDNWQSDIFVLRSGNVTFAEFNSIVKARQDKAEKELNQTEKAAQQAAANRPKPFYLTCLFDSPKQFIGFEIQYLVDEVNRTIHPNRGPKVESTSISESELVYVAVADDGSKTNVSISRLSGRLTMTSDSVLASANCQRATQQRF